MFIRNPEQLRRLAETLLRVERLAEAGGSDAHLAREGLREVARRMAVHLEVVRLADEATLLQILDPGGDGNEERFWAAAEVLFLDGILARAEGREADALDRLGKARILYERVGTGLILPDEVPDPAGRIQQIEALVTE